MRLPVASKARGAAVPRAVPDTEDLWKEFHDGLRSFVWRRVRDDADADDIVQRMFLQVHRKAPAVRDRDRLPAWLFQVARNAIVDHYRSPRRTREVASGSVMEMALLPHATVAGDAVDAAGYEEMAGCIRPMIDRLPAIYRRALTLVELEGRSQTAAAVVEGLSISGMKARVQRGRAQLKEMLLSCCESALAACAPSAGCDAGLTRPRAHPALRAPCGAGRRG
jgi:RNA polymerase sigma-70 factor (ECF subfamily)